MAASTKPTQKVIFVVGPTAVGKSAWALQQAIKYHGSIVNIDSVQFYRGLDVGSAAPSEAEKKIVPHYLYSYVFAPAEMTAGRYITDFYELLKTDIQFPLFVVGGTGFYIQALEKGMFDVEPIEEKFREEIENELAEFGPEKLYTELKQKDPDTKIHLNDHYRLVRALEILRHTGKIPSKLKNQPVENKNGLKLPYIKIGFSFEKEIFLARVKHRTKQMIANGMIDETNHFLKQGFGHWAPLSSVGFKECVEYIKNDLSREWLEEAIEQSTMKLIKKQKTWFKRDASILWSDSSADSLNLVGQKLDQFLMDD
ncbi:MAG: tRNA (adenosine(37)-N6)-dimethylallyltransferase MiaA [Bdellovibrio sp.]|nr:tRNA (adenosine(37)-N6)-dimethylallyltransferase MiaA [Bdellovibrio sp.]